MRVAALKALQMTVKVPDRAKIKGAGTAAIVDLVGFREDNVLPVAAFYGRGDTTINFLAEVLFTLHYDEIIFSVMSELSYSTKRFLNCNIFSLQTFSDNARPAFTPSPPRWINRLAVS